MKTKMKMKSKAVGVCVCVLAAGAAVAQNDIDDSRRNAIVRAIESVSPAVVSINVIQVEAHRVLDAFSRDFWDFFYDPRPRYLLRKRQINSVGSGFFVDNQGHIVTNYHVIEDADAVASVALADGRVLDVEVVGVDERADVAVLRASADRLPRAALGDSDDLINGEWAIAIGNPFGGLMADPQPSVSVGVVSATHRRVSPSVGGGERLYQDMIQTDAAINPGNSGGPLANAKGEVIGVNTMIFSPSGGSVGLGFALPINRVRRVVDEILRYGRRRDCWAGFHVEDVDSLRRAIREELGVRAESGCIVSDILTDSPAYEAGLRPGDVIVAVNGQPVRVSSDLDFAIWSMFVGDSVSLELDRQGKRQTVSFTIKELTK